MCHSIIDYIGVPKGESNPRYRRERVRADSRGAPVPPWRLHPVKGVLEGHWAVWVDENFRLTFRFEGKNVVEVDYRDYH